MPAFSARQLSDGAGTNFVPRMSSGAEFQVILPIVNAPFRLYYAYNPLRLFKNLPQQLAVDDPTFRSMFPNSGAGQYSYAAGAATLRVVLRTARARKTLRLTVSTTF